MCRSSSEDGGTPMAPATTAAMWYSRPSVTSPRAHPGHEPVADGLVGSASGRVPTSLVSRLLASSAGSCVPRAVRGPSRVVPMAGSAAPESGPCPRGFFPIPLTPDDRQVIPSTQALREPGHHKKLLRNSAVASSGRNLAQTPLTTITASPSSDQKVLAVAPHHSTQGAQAAYPSHLFQPFYEVQLHGLGVDIRI